MIWFAACSRKFSIAKRSRRSSYLATLAILSGARFVYLAFLVLSHIVCSFLMIPQKALWPDSIRFDLSARCITRNMDKTSSTHDTTTGGWQPWQYRSSARNFQIPRQKRYHGKQHDSQRSAQDTDLSFPCFSFLCGYGVVLFYFIQKWWALLATWSSWA